MMKIALRITVLAGVFACSLPAYAQFAETWVSHNGNDANVCNTETTPCRTLAGALSMTLVGGQINVLDAGDFGVVNIGQSVSIVNAISGTATMIPPVPQLSQIARGGPNAEINITAGANGVVTLRGLTLNAVNSSIGVLINNASQVNIENCLIMNQNAGGIEVIPSTDGQSQTLASSFNIEIQDSTITGNAGGIKIAPTTATPINVIIDKTRINNNTGGGLKADGTSGGPITVSISDSTISLNAGNGVNAVGPSNNVIINLNNDVIASNADSGVQANGANAAVVVNNTSILDNTVGDTASVSGGRVLTYGNNRIIGNVGSGFTGTLSPQ